MPTIASLDCAVPRGVLPLGGICATHVMRLLCIISGCVILLFKAEFKSLRGIELPKLYNTTSVATAVSTFSTTPDMTRSQYIA